MKILATLSTISLLAAFALGQSAKPGGSIVAASRPAQAPAAPSSQPARPFKAEYAAMSSQAVSEKVHEITPQTPGTNIRDPLPTPQQQALAVEACEYFWAWRTRSMDEIEKYMVGSFGYRVGFIAGDAETLFAAARLAWDAKHNEASAFLLARASVLAGKMPDALEALAWLGKNGSGGMQTWAQQYTPVAKLSTKPLLAKFTLDSGSDPRDASHAGATPVIETAKLQGKVVLIFFWSAADGSLAKEIEGFRQVHESNKGNPDFAMYSFCLDATAGTAKVNFPWPGGKEASSLRERFAMGNIPLAVVVAPSGRVVCQAPPMFDEAPLILGFCLRQAALLKGQTAPEVSAASASAGGPRGDDAGVAQAQEAAAEQKYRQAMANLQAGQRDKAMALLRDILVRYPKTATATKANEQLKQMK